MNNSLCVIHTGILSWLLKVWDPTANDYEVPIQVNKPVDGIKAKNPEYEIVAIPNRNAFSFKIVRKSTGTVMWVDTIIVLF